MKTVEEIVGGLIAYLVSHGQTSLLPEIVEKLAQKVKEEENSVYVSSALALTSEEEVKIGQFLKKKFGKEFEVRVKIDPQIGGGLTIRIGDQLIDRSLSGKLRELVEQLER